MFSTALTTCTTIWTMVYFVADWQHSLHQPKTSLSCSEVQDAVQRLQQSFQGQHSLPARADNPVNSPISKPAAQKTKTDDNRRLAVSTVKLENFTCD